MVDRFKFKTGDWVRTTFDETAFVTAIVYSTHEQDHVLHVVIPGKRNLKTTRWASNCRLYNQVNTPREDRLAITDLALQTNDKDWFNQLLGVKE